MKLLFRKKIKVAEVYKNEKGSNSTVCPYCNAKMVEIYETITTMKCWDCGKPMELKRETA